MVECLRIFECVMMMMCVNVYDDGDGDGDDDGRCVYECGLWLMM